MTEIPIISKTKLKAEADAAQHIGKKLVDLSKDKAATWEKISDASFHIVKKHPSKSGAYLAGSGGRISFVEL